MGCAPHLEPGKELIVIDNQGREIFVAHGLESDGRVEYGSFRRKPSGSLQRVKTKWLPMREYKEDAEQDLMIYAQIKKWKLKK